MNRLKLSFACVIITCSLAIPTYAITNPGFESGDFTGWTANDSYSDVVTSHTSYDSNTTYSPQYGSYFARLITGLGEDVYTTLSQSFFLNASDVLQGSAAFDTGDYAPFNDNAFVKIEDPNAISTTLWVEDVNGVGDLGNSPWTLWSFTAPLTGIYTLTFGVANNLDNGADSIALFDMPQIDPPVSTPDNGSTLLLLGASLVAIFGLSRRSLKI